MSNWDTANGGLEVGTPDGPVKVSTSVFKDAVKEVAKAKGYGKFKVFVDGEEIIDPDDPDNPVTLPSDGSVRIEPYNKAG